ncbi:hypothetical protein D3C74_352870 [compost metagenome]
MNITYKALHLIHHILENVQRLFYRNQLLIKHRSDRCKHVHCVLNRLLNLLRDGRYSLNGIIGLHCKLADFFGYYDKALACCTCSGRLNRCVKGENIRLLGHLDHRCQNVADRVSTSAQLTGIFFNKTGHA